MMRMETAKNISKGVSFELAFSFKPSIQDTPGGLLIYFSGWMKKVNTCCLFLLQAFIYLFIIFLVPL